MSSSAFLAAHQKILALVQKFEKGRAHYMSPAYGEAEVRKDFIDPFWKALGWDVDHESQHNPYEQEVRIERGQRQQGQTTKKRADYAFFLAPDFKNEAFFVEAKKPSVELANAAHYFQTARYGYNASCPLCVLTDFEQIHVIDCRPRPDLRHVRNQGYRTYTYTDYPDADKFSEIYWLFSREAVAAGNLRKAADALPRAGKGTRQKALFSGGYKALDESFLDYLDGVRLELARAFKKADPSLDGDTLTEVTQRSIDRLVFMRFLEDKGLEPDDIIRHFTSWKDFVRESRRLDAKYNGVVFKHHAQLDDTAAFAGADERAFLAICEDLSGLNNPYLFSYFPIHILGSIYERFLGKVVVTDAEQADIEEKPELRKAGGVYYTPKYVVDYIIERTVGRMIDGKTPKEIASMRFADIACGSGSFLIGVYEYLLDYHRKWYAKELGGYDKPLSPQKNTPHNQHYGAVELRNGAWALTMRSKQDVLLNNVFGVDLDAQAVEVTQLSLFLKMLEDESLATMAGGQLTLTSKVLPDLTKNIQCGNALIGEDYAREMNFEEGLAAQKAVNAFDWRAGFPQVFRGGGFDAVVGNPPWVQSKFLPAGEKEYYADAYISMVGQYDLFNGFYERAVWLLKEGGLHGYIIPNRLASKDYIRFRKFLVDHFAVEEIADVGESIFKGVVMPSCIIFLRKSAEDVETQVKTRVADLREDFKLSSFKRDDVIASPDYVFPIYQNDAQRKLLAAVQGHPRLRTFVDNARGVEIGRGSSLISTVKSKNAVPFLVGADMGRYYISGQRFLTLGDPDVDYKHASLYGGEKIIIRKTGHGINATYDDAGHYVIQVIYILKRKPETAESLTYLLGILNSRLMSFVYFRMFGEEDKAAFPHLRQSQLLELPFRRINFSSKSERTAHDEIAALVSSLLQTKARISGATTDRDRSFLEQKAASLDRQIDGLVYRLYGLSDNDIALVESA